VFWEMGAAAVMPRADAWFSDGLQNKGKPYNFDPTVYIDLPFQAAHPWRDCWNPALTMGSWADGGLRVGSP